MMERSEILAKGELKFYGMKAAFDETIAVAVKRQHEPQRIVGDLLTAEMAEKQARSIKYQITIAKLPLAKEIDDFRFDGSPVNEALVRDLAGGEFLAHQRNVVFVGDTGTLPRPARRSLTAPPKPRSIAITCTRSTPPCECLSSKNIWVPTPIQHA